MRRFALPVSGVVLLCAFTACAGGTFGRRADPAEDRAALAASLVALRQQVTVQELELARLRERIAALEARRPGGATPVREEAALTYAPPRVEDTDLPAAPLPSSGTAVSASAQVLYDQAYALVQQGKHAEAEALMQRFLASHGASDLADNAAYWIGETRYARSDWQGAFEAFKSAVEQYPEGNKVADSLFKVGKSLEKLGDREGAREVLTEVARRFPGTAAAAAAAEALPALR